VAAARCYSAGVRVWLLSSGSSGNVAIVEAEGHRLLIDAGVGLRATVTRMKALGADLFPRSVSGIVVTHHHQDHIAKVEPLTRALRAPLFLHRGIEADVVRRRIDVREYVPGTTLHVGPFAIDSLPVPHDAPQVAIAVRAGGRRFAIVTDLGHVPPGLAELLGDCDVALVEANHCRDLLAVGPYPPRLRDRVGGSHGHLANHQTAELARRLSGTRLARMYLGHLSRVNNTPARALETVRAAARDLDVQVVPHGVPCVIDVARHPTQLAFGFGAARVQSTAGGR
jgi:phosphoribosyl 1,2-cyclic phosphodiesterase